MAETGLTPILWSPAEKEKDSAGLPAPIEHQQERKVTDMATVKLSGKAVLEKLHSKYSQKPWNETLKLVRYCMDKPAANALKGFTDHPVIRCGYTLQEAVKAKSLSTLLTRIEAISKQKGLESHLGPNGRICYITSEMFYIEVQVKRNGHVGFVKLAHHGDSPTVCKELLSLLRTKDFEGFGRSLEGLLHLYNIPGNSEIKAKVYLALCSLEANLNSIFNLSRPTTEDRVATILHGKVGYLSPRCGGTPMKIEYYISPYQVLEEKLKPGTRVIGVNAYVTVVGTNNWYHLPVSPSFQGASQESGSTNGFSTFTEESSMALPACFFLTFAHPEPILLPLIHKIQNITGIPVFATGQAHLHELLIDIKVKEPAVHREIQFIVSIPGCMDQCYIMSSSCENESNVMGALVNKIPFTDPSHVPSVLEILRYQAAYSTLLNSCLSPTINPKDHNGMLHFEVSLQKDLKICISFQNPSGGSLSCVVVEVLSPRKLLCTLYTSSCDPPLLCNSEFIGKILECCMSIPITMRTIFKKAHKEEVAETMETSCAKGDGLSSQNSDEIHSDIFSKRLCNKEEEEEKPSTHGKSVLLGSVCDPIEELFPETNGGIISVDSHGSSPAQETNSTFTEDTYYNIPQVNSSSVEQPNSSLAEESCSSLTEDPNAMIVQQLSPIMADVPSPNITEDPSSSITGELSSSITEELGMSVSGFAMPRSVPEQENDESY
ncbi:PREDICTED: mediator of RNA polymerase II transcription subunit 1-like [Nanorana parkeri]|uniref:mediator of RNA polymerase II transcription subunit 1-like n=1 Tax=Nanorana parkeri TaxID=125878 RepID=UPI00085481CE|nr:PREDICTED: mediator of RNA polymerase II transcription subunit 1-like [Nanorana parkeri]